MHNEVLAPATATVFKKMSNHSFLDSFYLSGGTGLTLHLGHRESIDLDFFTPTSFDPQQLIIALEKIAPLSDTAPATGTLNCFMNGVQLQFLEYPYDLLEVPTGWNGVAISSIIDIACTKLITISSRGSKKDFIDLHFLLEKFELEYLLKQLEKKYPTTDYNLPHILKSLVYFEDADHQPEPRMHLPFSWDLAKKSIRQSVARLRLA